MFILLFVPLVVEATLPRVESQYAESANFIFQRCLHNPEKLVEYFKEAESILKSMPSSPLGYISEQCQAAHTAYGELKIREWDVRMTEAETNIVRECMKALNAFEKRCEIKFTLEKEFVRFTPKHAVLGQGQDMKESFLYVVAGIDERKLMAFTIQRKERTAKDNAAKNIQSALKSMKKSDGSAVSEEWEDEYEK